MRSESIVQAIIVDSHVPISSHQREQQEQMGESDAALLIRQVSWSFEHRMLCRPAMPEKIREINRKLPKLSRKAYFSARTSKCLCTKLRFAKTAFLGVVLFCVVGRESEQPVDRAVHCKHNLHSGARIE